MQYVCFAQCGRRDSLWFVWLLLCVWLIAVVAGLQLEKCGDTGYQGREKERERNIERETEQDNERKGERE